MGITQILFVLVIFAAVGIVALVLMQQSKGDAGSAFGGGGGGSQSMFGSRGSANFLSRTTSILVTVFFLGSLALAYFYTKQNDISRTVVEDSVLNTEETTEAAPSDIPELPAAAQDAIEAASESDVPAVPELPTTLEVPAESEVPVETNQ